MIEIPQFIETEKVRELLPQKSKMALIDRVISHDFASREIICETDIKSDNLFFDAEAGGVPSFVSFELMAQSVALLASLGSIASGTKAKSGMVLSVNDFSAETAAFKCGQTLKIAVKEDFSSGAVFRYDGNVSADGIVLSQAKITVIEADF